MPNGLYRTTQGGVLNGKFYMANVRQVGGIGPTLITSFPGTKRINFGNLFKHSAHIESTGMNI